VPALPKLMMCAANMTHSTQLIVARSHLQICSGHFTFQFLFNFKAALAFLGVMMSSL
jgi:hypothetical protein